MEKEENEKTEEEKKEDEKEEQVISLNNNHTSFNRFISYFSYKLKYNYK